MRNLLFIFSFYFSLGINSSGNSQNAGLKTNSSVVKIEIKINTTHSTIRINNQILSKYNIDLIQKILGKPNRIEEHNYDSYIEEFPLHKDESPSIYPIKVNNYYYIYDLLGIMFYTQNGEATIKEPTRISIHFKNKRTFSHIKKLPFSPKNNFTGVFCINGDTVATDKKLVPQKVNYQTNEFDLFHTKFAPTSYTTIIDCLYSYNSRPYLQMFLDSEKTQRISYIIVF